MDGDPRSQRASLLKKYDIPVEHLSYEYAEKCSNKKELERMIRILRSGEEGSYPDLLRVMEERLRVLAPDSRVLRVETPVLTKECLNKEEWDAVENELLSWENEMNIMDKSLDFEKGRFEVVGNKNLPEVRKVEQQNILPKTQEKSKVVINNNNNINNKRIKSGDYDAWDKFDVDKELLKLDVEEERKQEINEKKKREAKKLEKEKKIEIAEVNKENYSSMEQQVLANQAKDRGNESYKSGDLGSALKYYEISIKLYPSANAYNNRAMTYLKLKQYDKAFEDCNKVLHMEKNNVKALHRRATAYQNMKSDKENLNYDELALQDLLEIIRLEPNNKVAQADIQKLKKKLNIEDSGKKFRMTISDGSVNKVNSNQIEEKNSTHKIQDNSLSVEKLPLTYYGPSTSTFQCEPYSMVHRALSGSSIPGRVLCKCNSNIPRQNPLCQKCGEAMSTPKPVKAIKAKSEIRIITDKDKESLKAKTNVSDTVLPVKSENSLITKLQSESYEKDSKQQEGKLAELKNQKESDNKIVNELGKNELISKKAMDVSKDNLPSNKIDKSKKDNKNSEIASEKPVKSQEAVFKQTSPSKVEEIKNAEAACNNDTKTAANSSSLNDSSHNTKKSKNKKKKSKENKESKTLRKHLETFKIEPVKVVYANKYLHPTSVEPKVKNEPSPKPQNQESNSSTNTQFKAFVPNRKCYSTEYKRTEPSAIKVAPSPFPKPCPPPSDKANYDLSSEGNKENISENSRNNSVDTGAKDGGGEDFKKEVVDSAYEFTKAWEELKKLDESYVKRAEIIRKIKPTDLSKVIGIKLDSDMLSCILECLLRHVVETEPKRVVELLKQLPQIPRFELVSMFLADSDKKKMKQLIQAAEDRGFKLEEDVKKSLAALR